MPYADPEKQKEAKLRWQQERMKDPRFVKKRLKQKKKQVENWTDEQREARRKWMTEYKRKRRAAGIDP
jgi:hypothetical protein